MVDDGSTDDTAGVVGRLKAARVKLIGQENQGQSAAINTGVEQARGAYIKILDADDWINQEHIEVQFEVVDGETNVVVFKALRPRRALETIRESDLTARDLAKGFRAYQ